MRGDRRGSAERRRDVGRANGPERGQRAGWKNPSWEEKRGQLSGLLYLLVSFSPPAFHQQTTVVRARSNSLVRVIEVCVAAPFSGPRSPHRH